MIDPKNPNNLINYIKIAGNDKQNNEVDKQIQKDTDEFSHKQNIQVQREGNKEIQKLREEYQNVVKAEKEERQEADKLSKRLGILGAVTGIMALIVSIIGLFLKS